MAKYTSDANLIQGAAVAYKNYDNAPGMYAGLDKAIKAGTDTMNTAVKDYEAKKQKKRDQDNAWYKVAGDTYNAAGSFMKADGPELTDTIALLDALQPEYTKAMESGTAAEKAAVVGKYNNIKAGVNSHKQLRADISDDLIGASEANFNAGTLVGDDGRFGNFLTGLLKEDYKITYEEDSEGVKQKMYTVEDASYTLEEINEKTVRKDIIPAQNFYKALDALGANGVQYNDGKVKRAIDSIIPSGFNETREFMRGKNFTGKNIGEVMSLPENRKGIEATINKQLFDSGSGEGSVKGDGIIQDGEFENFVSAATDPYHPMWNKGGKVDKQGWEKSSRAIATELLVNSISNEHVKNNPYNYVINNASNEEAAQTVVVKPEEVFQGSRNPSGIFVNKADQIRMYNSISNKKEEINGADGGFYVLSGDGNSYMKFTGSEENTPVAGKKFYRSLLKNRKKDGLVGKNKGQEVSFEQMLENNAAYSTRLPGIQTQKEMDKQNEGLVALTAGAIRDSKARGEQSAFNRGPDGKLLPEGYTLNDLGEVVEVEGNNKYYNMISEK